MGVTPPEFCNVAVTFAVSAEPALRNAKDTETVSPTSIVPSGGVRLSETSLADSATISGEGAMLEFVRQQNCYPSCHRAKWWKRARHLYMSRESQPTRSRL